MDRITVLAPATVSNVNCGFDCLGFALSEPFDEVTVTRIEEPAIRIRHLDDFGVPEDPEKNVAGVALRALMDKLNTRAGFEVEITKHIKPGSGLGSSAASSAGAIVAANELLGKPFTNAELVVLAMEGEAVASGARHADNIAPCIFGGFTLVRSDDPIEIVPLKCPELYVAAVHPQIEIKTSEARAILPDKVALMSAVRQWSNLAALVASLSCGNLDLLRRSMVDSIVEPVRKHLLPFFDDVKGAALAAGAIGGGISGSGPSIFMLNETRETAERVGAAMSDVLCLTSVEHLVYVSPLDPRGVRIK